MLGWIKRLLRREPLSAVVEILVDGRWQAVRVIGKSGLHLTVALQDSKSRSLSTLMILPAECRDVEHANRLLIAMTEAGGEQLVWENGKPYSP